MNDLTDDARVRVTHNCMGWSSDKPHEINLEFATFAANCNRPVLDIGAGFGSATVAALEAGAEVFANDIDEDSLQLIQARIPLSLRTRLCICPGRFPADMDFGDGSFGAIHASNVLHFLEPADLDTGIQRIYDWLTPGGKVFVMVNSTHGQGFKGYVPTFLRNKALGMQWPGWVEDLSAYSSHPTLSLIPSRLHLFDADVLSRAFQAVGFKVDVAKEFRRSYLPEILWNDGRENVFLIGRKHPR